MTHEKMMEKAWRFIADMGISENREEEADYYVENVHQVRDMLSPDIYVKIHCNNCGEDHKCKTRFMVLFCPYCGNDFSE